MMRGDVFVVLVFVLIFDFPSFILASTHHIQTGLMWPAPIISACLLVPEVAKLRDAA